MRTLFYRLCNNDLPLPEYCVIKRIHFDSLGSDPSFCNIVENEPKLITVGVTDESGLLFVDLRPVRRQFRVRSEIIKTEATLPLSFSKEDILSFVDAVGDTNHIHREAPYVVPGCMILESVWNYWSKKYKAVEVSMHFHLPMIAGDQVSLIEIPEANHMEGYINDELIFSAYFYDEHSGLFPVLEDKVN